MLLGLGLLNLLELSSQGNVASGGIAIVESGVGVHEVDSIDIQSAFAIAFPSPTSELIAFVSGDHVLQAFDLALSGQMLVGQGLSFLVVGEVTGFGIAQVDVNGNFLLDLGLLFLNVCCVEANIAIGVLNISIGQLVASLQDLARAITSPSIVALGQSRGDDFRVSFSQNLGQIRIEIRIGNQSVKANRNFSCICKRCKRHAHDEHESGSQQSQQTSFKVRFLHVNFSYSLVFI